MTGTIITSIAACFLIFGAWVVDLACYHPHSVDPLAPIKITIAWK